MDILPYIGYVVLLILVWKLGRRTAKARYRVALTKKKKESHPGFINNQSPSDIHGMVQITREAFIGHDVLTIDDDKWALYEPLFVRLTFGAMFQLHADFKRFIDSDLDFSDEFNRRRRAMTLMAFQYRNNVPVWLPFIDAETRGLFHRINDQLETIQVTDELIQSGRTDNTLPPDAAKTMTYMAEHAMDDLGAFLYECNYSCTYPLVSTLLADGIMERIGMAIHKGVNSKPNAIHKYNFTMPTKRANSIDIIRSTLTVTAYRSGLVIPKDWLLIDARTKFLLDYMTPPPEEPTKDVRPKLKVVK